MTTDTNTETAAGPAPVLDGAPRPPQSLTVVLRAELRRVTRQGGCAPGLLVSTLVAAAVGLLTAIIVGATAEGDLRFSVLLSVEVTTAMAALLLTGTAIIYAGRVAQNDTTQIALTVVPQRRRLLLARVLSVVLWGFLATLLASSVVGLVALTTSRSPGSVVVLPAAVLAGSLAAALLVALALLVTVVVNGKLVAMLVGLGWWLILPLVLFIAGPGLPAWLAPVSDVVLRATPTTLFGQLATTSTWSATGAGVPLIGLGGLLVWVGLFGVLANRLFTHREL